MVAVRLRRFMWYYTRLWFCGRSEIESKSSRIRCLSPRHLVTTTPLSGIKLLTRCLQQIILVAKPTAVKIGPFQDLSLKRPPSVLPRSWIPKSWTTFPALHRLLIQPQRTNSLEDTEFCTSAKLLKTELDSTKVRRNKILKLKANMKLSDCRIPSP
jgi:hypothetical protein